MLRGVKLVTCSFTVFMCILLSLPTLGQKTDIIREILVQGAKRIEGDTVR